MPTTPSYQHIIGASLLPFSGEAGHPDSLYAMAYDPSNIARAILSYNKDCTVSIITRILQSCYPNAVFEKVGLTHDEAMKEWLEIRKYPQAHKRNICWRSVQAIDAIVEKALNDVKMLCTEAKTMAVRTEAMHVDLAHLRKFVDNIIAQRNLASTSQKARSGATKPSASLPSFTGDVRAHSAPPTVSD